MIARRPTLLPALFASSLALATTLTAPAAAQVSASATLDSDQRLRGFSLSDGRPALNLDLAYDHPSGVYLSGSVTAGPTAHDGVERLGASESLGYAAPLGPGRSWDIGVNNRSIEVYADRRRKLHYAEVYAGLSGTMLSGRLSYSPNYFTHGARTLYAELDGAWRPADDWRMLGHVGVFTPLGGVPGSRRERYDLRVGVARQFRHCELHLAWTATLPQPKPGSVRNRPALVAGATVFF